MRSDGFKGNTNACEEIGGLLHGLRYLPAPTYDRILGKPHPCCFQAECGLRGIGHRLPDNIGVVVSKWHERREAVRAVARRIAARCDRRQRRARIAKKIAQRGGRRRFATPSAVRRMNAGAT
jgi:hypothetical protein